MPSFAAGQCWTYRAPVGCEDSRLVVGAVLTFAAGPPLVCCSVWGAPQRQPDGSVARVTIPFLPMTEAALRDSVIALDGEGEVPGEFLAQFESWHGEGRGLSYFTVAFDGHLDRMIARQMAEIAGVSAAV